jgi:hypothetical protein
MKGLGGLEGTTQVLTHAEDSNQRLCGPAKSAEAGTDVWMSELGRIRWWLRASPPQGKVVEGTSSPLQSLLCLTGLSWIRV